MYKDDRVDGVIFVVDSTDRDRIDDARWHLHDFLDNEFSVKFRETALLVLVNKQDIPDCMSL